MSFRWEHVALTRWRKMIDQVGYPGCIFYRLSKRFLNHIMKGDRFK